MADVIIHRCTLRVVRRKGWSWGAAPQSLLKAAVAALPSLIARKLTALFADAPDTESSERVCLTIPIKLSEMLALGSEAVLAAETNESRFSAALDQRLNAAVALAFAKEILAFRPETRESTNKEVALDVDAQTPQNEPPRGSHVFKVLSTWKAQGELDVHLASFTHQELEAWQSALLPALLELASASKAFRYEVIGRLIEIEQKFEGSAQDGVTALRLSLVALLEIGERLQSASTNEAAEQEIVAQLFERLGIAPAEEEAAEQQEALPVKPVAPAPLPQTLLKPPEPDVVRSSPQLKVEHNPRVEVHIRAVLPFLLLGPLAKIGYLDTLAATLEANRLEHQAHLFAAALAFKVLSPAERGWRRADEDLTVAAAFAGIEDPPAGDDLAEFARKMEGHLTVLDSLLAYTLIKGHNPADPVLLVRTGEEDREGLLLAEIKGFFPLGWAPDLQALNPVMKYFSDTHLLIQRDSAKRELLRELHASGFRFITDAPPTRGESWRELRRMSFQRWYSNDFAEKDATLLRVAEQLEGAAEEAELIWRTFKVERPGIPTAKHSDLERSLTLAASLALGTISWTLWRTRETATPRLALERFGKLEARVRFTSTAVQVHLPLGQRHSDLYEHGLLANVRNVPWLQGRKVEFLGG